ncbi:hypothetical protein V1511DRAFT_413983 [Dipodascopsis uninucleata]
MEVLSPAPAYASQLHKTMMQHNHFIGALTVTFVSDLILIAVFGFDSMYLSTLAIYLVKKVVKGDSLKVFGTELELKQLSAGIASCAISCMAVALWYLFGFGRLYSSAGDVINYLINTLQYSFRTPANLAPNILSLLRYLLIKIAEAEFYALSTVSDISILTAKVLYYAIASFKTTFKTPLAIASGISTAAAKNQAAQAQIYLSGLGGKTYLQQSAFGQLIYSSYLGVKSLLPQISVSFSQIYQLYRSSKGTGNSTFLYMNDLTYLKKVMNPLQSQSITEPTEQISLPNFQHMFYSLLKMNILHLFVAPKSVLENPLATVSGMSASFKTAYRHRFNICRMIVKALTLLADRSRYFRRDPLSESTFVLPHSRAFANNVLVLSIVAACSSVLFGYKIDKYRLGSMYTVSLLISATNKVNSWSIGLVSLTILSLDFARICEEIGQKQALRLLWSTHRFLMRAFELGALTLTWVGLVMLVEIPVIFFVQSRSLVLAMLPLSGLWAYKAIFIIDRYFMRVAKHYMLLHGKKPAKSRRIARKHMRRSSLTFHETHPDAKVLELIPQWQQYTGIESAKFVQHVVKYNSYYSKHYPMVTRRFEDFIREAMRLGIKNGSYRECDADELHDLDLQEISGPRYYITLQDKGIYFKIVQPRKASS